MTQGPLIRVVLADDHHLVREGIRALLDQAGDIDVVGEAADGQAAMELVEQLLPDVLLVDIAMPRLDGMQVIERVRLLEIATRTVVLSMYADKTLALRALRNGACGYLLKHAVTDELLLAIRAACRGEVYLSPAIAGPLVSDLAEPPRNGQAPGLPDQLTPREREVLQLIAEGRSNAAIAQLLDVSVKTVEKHRSNLMTKLGVGDLPSLMRAGIRHRLIFLDGAPYAPPT